MKFFSKYPWSVPLLLIIPTLVWCGNGCEQPQNGQPQTVDTNIQSRFRVTAEYVRFPAMIPNVCIYLVEDTQGTNNFVFVKFEFGDGEPRLQPISPPSTKRLEN